ncbi:MAG: VCBS repeat-containing protein, partial [Planctomycetota bacterium]
MSSKKFVHTDCAAHRFKVVFLALLICSVGCFSNDEATPQADAGGAVASTSGSSHSQAEALEPHEMPVEGNESKFVSVPYTEGVVTGKFTDMDPDETGIDLVHVWDPPQRHASLIVGTFGCGVAIGDFDNDGWQDVFVARQNDAGRLYRNLSGMRFEDVTLKMGIDPQGMWAVGTTFVDINNDGRLDLYLCGYDCPNRLYINQGDKFTEEAARYGLDFKGSSIVMNFADYDLDGDLDGYLVTNFQKPTNIIRKPQLIRKPGKPPEVAPEFRERFFLIKRPNGGYQKSRAGQFDHLYHNDGGKFVEVTEEAGIGLQPYIGLSSSWWDYNEDGWPDLYVANDFKGPDFLYRNNGPNDKGVVTFTDVSKTAFPHTPWYSMGSDFGDINNDGRLDYLASDMAGTNHYRDKLSMGSMSGPDSAAWFLNAVDPPQYMRNAVYLNTGTESFNEVAYLCGLAKSDWTWTVKFADFDNDGWQDVFFTNGMTRDLFNSDLKNRLAKEMESAKAEAIANGRRFQPARFASEFWKRQKPFQLENMAFKNTGDLKFKDVGKKWGLDHLGVSMGSAVGDLDNDGDLDVIVSGFEEPIRVYRNDLGPSHSVRFQLVGSGDSNRNALGARVELSLKGSDAIQTRYVSPTRGFMSTSENVVHFGLGEDAEIEKVTVRWPNGELQSLDSVAVNHTHRIIQSPSPSSVANNLDVNPPSSTFRKNRMLLSDFRHAEQEFDDFERQPLLPNKYSQMGPGMAWGDIDGDGDDDLFMGGASYAQARIIENLGGGEFAESEQDCFRNDSRSEDLSGLFFDVDGDFDLDLYVVSGGVECEPGDDILQDRLYLNDGKGKFKKSESWLPEMKTSGAAIAAADFDKDGDIDLVVPGRIVPGRYPESPESYLLRNEGSQFTIA